MDESPVSVHIMNSNVHVSGTQAVARAAHLLRIVTSTPHGSVSTSASIAEKAGLSRSTAHRLLSALYAEGLLDRDADTGDWVPGPELFLMGSVAAARYDVSAIGRDIVRSLAARTEESAFLSVRRGDETVCLVREEGSFPIRSFVLSEGVRFPLGVASAGLAILAFLPPDEIDAYLERTPELGNDFGDSHNRDRLMQRIRDTRDRGYAVNPGLIVEGSWGIGAAVFGRDGKPDWALSLTGVEFRFTGERMAMLGRTLMAHAHKLSTLLASSSR